MSDYILALTMLVIIILSITEISDDIGSIIEENL